MSHNDDAVAPMAKKVPLEMTEHGDTRVDDYFWMRLSDAQKEAETPDAQTQDVLDYLAAENDYIDSKLAHTEGPAREALRRDRGPHQEGRPQRAGAQPRILVLHPVRGGQGVRHQLPQTGGR